ncbi:MAG: hypothetical protein ACI4J0_12340 [Huintestinicola sp.]|uniref:hypothetical protein n=1 Tax=Huintestinicola sp. TaxID=2981661 RepID=UPI003F067C25
MNNANICSVFSGGAIVTEEELTEFFINMKEKGIKAVASNCERGFPMTALSAADKAGLDIIAVMPFEGQPDSWNEELRRKFFMLHKKAATRFMISTHRSENCYILADELLLSICGTAVIAGSNPHIQRLAEEMGKETVNIHTADSVRVKL